MKKAITVFLSIAIIGLVSSQVTVKDNPKAIVLKDSIKKDKSALQSEIAGSDSVVIKGKFKLFKKAALASYYHDKFNGRRTSSGSKFDNTKYTAAHRTLPFGTKLKVTNEANGKFVIVEVTDRGPFSRGRELDLTRKTFMEITSNKNSGVITVKIEISE